jgi:23S rRNA-/tRNA-specific pseudouridylate synthase
VSIAAGFWSGLPLGRGVVLLAHDANGVVAFDKPAGVLSHPNRPADEPRSLLQARYLLDGEVYEWAFAGTTRRLWLLNRLDSATSGVILAAADGTLAAEIRAQFRRKEVRKVYHAVVFGVPRQPAEVWRDTLAIEKKAGRIRTAAAAGRIPAESRMTVERDGGGAERVALLRLEPRTGRSHQLRVQCAKRGLPIVGDQTYGDFARNRAFAKAAATKRMFLHSSETQFRYRFGGGEWEFVAKAPLPLEFENVF